VSGSDPRRIGTVYFNKYFQTTQVVLDVVECDGIRRITEVMQSCNRAPDNQPGPDSWNVHEHTTRWDPKDEVLYQPVPGDIHPRCK
jgi:hypothetical protein